MKPAEFKWKPLSRRQKKILEWWTDNSPYKDYDGIIADGAIRSGKTISMGFSFVVWAMERFSGENFAMCGKTIGALRRNVIKTLKRQLKAEGYTVEDKRSEQVLEISIGGKSNSFYLFGGKDEGSQDLIQGITLAGVLFDEVVLMPRSFVDQALGRCSVDGSKFWFNCNPGSPLHWFYRDFVKKAKEKRLVYLHFTMADNLTLTERIRQRYERQYAGLFYKRFILGLWCVAEGIIYDMFSKEKHILTPDKLPPTEGAYFVSCDYGTQNPMVFLLWRKVAGTGNGTASRWVMLREYYYSGREQRRQKTDTEYADDLGKWLDGITPQSIIIDPSAASMIAELRKRHYPVQSARNDVEDGIRSVAQLIANNRIIVCSDCKRTIEEFGIYSWDEKAAERGEETPLKTNDHGMDATRYFVYTKRLAITDGSKKLSASAAAFM